MEFPNYFSTRAVMDETTGGPRVFTFGFSSRYLRIANRGADNLWVNLQGSTGASTEDIDLVSSGELEVFGGPPLGAVSVFHPNLNTTTTGTNLEVNVAAWAELRTFE